MVREVRHEDLNELLGLYTFLHEDSIPEPSEHLSDVWDMIIEDSNHHLIVNEIGGKLVSSSIASGQNCYKMMLLTGSKKPETLRFYENAGYNSSDKTAFIQWISMEK